MIEKSIPIRKMKKKNNHSPKINKAKIDFFALAIINSAILTVVNLFNIDWKFLFNSESVNLFYKIIYTSFDVSMLFCVLFILLMIVSLGSKILHNIFTGFLIIVSSFIIYFKTFFNIKPNYENIIATFEASTEELINFINFGSVTFVFILYLITIFIKYKVMVSYIKYSNNKVNLYNQSNLETNLIKKIFIKLRKVNFIILLLVIFLTSIYVKFFTFHKYVITNITDNSSISTIAFRNSYTKHYLLQCLFSTTDYAINSYKYKKYSNKENIFADAKYNSSEPITVIFVLGESARIDNWQLYGYNRDNNDNLMQLKNTNALYTFNAKACKSSTLPALSCILSGDDINLYNMEEHSKSSIFSAFNSAKFRNVLITPNNLSIMRYWFSELQYVNKLISFTDLNATIRDRFIMDDDIFEHAYQEIENDSNENKMIMLQMRGSHGNYCHRYTDKHKKFGPTCCDYNLAICNKQELFNAYDNTIVYTDHILNELILKLKNKNAIVVYTSDHGESLGEGGYYGHGNESENIPDEQLRVPLFVWFSDKFKELNPDLVNNIKLSQDELQANGKKIDHSFVIHTIMGCANLSSKSINQSKNLCYIDSAIKEINPNDKVIKDFFVEKNKKTKERKKSNDSENKKKDNIKIKKTSKKTSIKNENKKERKKSKK